MCSPLGKKLWSFVVPWALMLHTQSSFESGIRPGIWPSWLNLVIHCQAHSSSVSQHKFLLFLLRTLLWARCWVSWPGPSSPDGYTAVTSCHTQHSFPSVFPEPLPHWLQSSEWPADKAWARRQVFSSGTSVFKDSRLQCFLCSAFSAGAQTPSQWLVLSELRLCAHLIRK